MASEVVSDLRIELSDLNYLCYHVYLASKGLHEMNDTTEEIYDPLTCVASPQVKRTTGMGTERPQPQPMRKGKKHCTEKRTSALSAAGRRRKYICMYRGVNKGLYVLLSRTQAGPGRTVTQEQEEISRNRVHTSLLADP